MTQREFPAAISRVYDGDTVDLWCDQGFDNWRFTKIRLLGVATRELSMVGGKEARDFLIALLPPRSYPTEPTCIAYSYKWDKYAPRIDGDILLYNGRLVTELLVESGHAVAWDGKGKQPLPPWPIPPTSFQSGTVFLP